MLETLDPSALLQMGFSMFVAGYLLIKTSKESQDLHTAITELTAWLKAKDP